MAEKKISKSKNLESYAKSLWRSASQAIEAREREYAGKIKVCVTYMGPSKRARKVCKTLTPKQVAKLVGIPRGSKITRVTHF